MAKAIGGKAKSYHLSFVLPVATIRPFNTFGPRQSARAVIQTIIAQALTGPETTRAGASHPVRKLNYVKDETRIKNQKAPDLWERFQRRSGVLFPLGTRPRSSESGMRWVMAGACAMLDMRCVYLSVDSGTTTPEEDALYHLLGAGEARRVLTLARGDAKDTLCVKPVGVQAPTLEAKRQLLAEAGLRKRSLKNLKT